MRIPLCLPISMAALLLAVSQSIAAQEAPAATSAIAPNTNSSAPEELTIPGPLRPLLRMAGISQKASADEILPLLARNVYVQGYLGWQDKGTPTEFLILLRRYVNQAKELSALAGPDGTIRIANCEQAQPLLRILGYRLREACGQHNAALITAEPERAFVTTDSGFPLPALEDALRRGIEFSYAYSNSQVPVLFTEKDWIRDIKTRRPEDYGLLQMLLHRPTLARLYWGLSRLDPETRDALKKQVGLQTLMPLAPDLDFYGSNICIRSGRVQVPGGEKAEDSWKDLVGASPEAPGEFVPKLLAKDNGWLAAYFDSMARITQERQQQFADRHQLKPFYEAFRGSDVSSDAARPAFRLASGLLLLLTRMEWDASGQPHIPGGLEVWKQILNAKSESKMVRAWGKRANHFTRPEQLAEAMVAFSRVDADQSPLRIYLLLNEIDSQRSPDRQLKPETVRELAKKFNEYGDQYLIFSEFPELNDEAMIEFVKVADSLDKTSNHTLRGNAMGTFQASVGLWQILARQRQIPATQVNESWHEVIQPYAKVSSQAGLFDAGRNSMQALMRAAGNKSRLSQDDLIEVIAGPRESGTETQRVHNEVAKSLRAVMDGQRLVSLDTLLALADGLERVSKGTAAGSSLLPLAGELREFEMPRPIFTSSERTEWAVGIYNNRHTELQMQTDLTKVLKASPTAAQLEEARGQLAPFLRDTLVGLNYAYYEPPGSQLLRTNPLFVRSHDFSGDTVAGVEGLWRAPQLFGQGTPAGGGARFGGSIADLPYALSEAEQDFITPENVQALIWREAVPTILTSAILPRWWDVSRNELHAVALYQAAGEELLKAAQSNDELRARVLNVLADRMLPKREAWLDDALRAGRPEEVLTHITPADTFYLTAEFRRRFHDETPWGAAGKELDALSQRFPEELSWARLSRDFGVPHKTLAQTYSRELLNVKPFPAFAGYSSRLLAESWDSNNLYWARLADELGYPPVALNRLVPELTRRMVAKIFATDFEDWLALLRAMRETGEEFRQGKIDLFPTASTSAKQMPVN